jgi:hypothetical protein
MISDAALEYGALGVLLLVLGGVGYWLRWYTKEQQAVVCDLIKEQQVVTRDLMDRFDAIIREQWADWKKLVRTSIEAQASATAALSQIAHKLESCDVARQQEHGEILARLER